MGYDMYFADPPSEEEELTMNAARVAFEAACKARDQFEFGTPEAEAEQMKVDETYHAMYAAQPWYFRLNVWGMGTMREVMDEAGMLCYPPTVDWDSITADPETEQDEYERQAEALRASHNGECPGIPWWKLSSNDGWLVSPAEIRAALAKLRRTKPGTVLDEDTWRLFTEWCDWMRAACEHGGFRVW